MSQHYTTVNMIRTMTDVLGLDHLGLFDATQQPMLSVFDLGQELWNFSAEVSGLLTAPGVTLPIPSSTKVFGGARKATHDVKYWAQHTKDMDFDVEDKLDAADYNRVMWKGLMGERAYPSVRSKVNLREK